MLALKTVAGILGALLLSFGFVTACTQAPEKVQLVADVEATAQPLRLFTPAQLAAMCSGFPDAIVSALSFADPHDSSVTLVDLPNELEVREVTILVDGSCSSVPLLELPYRPQGRTLHIDYAILLQERGVVDVVYLVLESMEAPGRIYVTVKVASMQPSAPSTALSPLTT